MSAKPQTAALEALVEAHTQELHLPTVRRRFRALAEEAARAQQTPLAYLAALLEAEVAERAERRERRRLLDARFPMLKRLEDFRFDDNPTVPQATIAALAEGSWIDDRDTVILSGESGTGKTHLAIALAICACQQGRRVRFTTLAGLANELQEAESRRELNRVVARYARIDARRAGLPRPARRCRRARLPSDLRTQRTRLAHRDNEPPLRRVDEGLPRPPPRQSGRRPLDTPRPHHRHRQRELALQARARPQQTTSRSPGMTSGPRRAPAPPLRLRLRSRTAARHTISYETKDKKPDGGWGHFKRPRRGHCKRPQRTAARHTISYETKDKKPDGGWGHFKRPRRGHCKRPQRHRVVGEVGACCGERPRERPPSAPARSL